MESTTCDLAETIAACTMIFFRVRMLPADSLSPGCSRRMLAAIQTRVRRLLIFSWVFRRRPRSITALNKSYLRDNVIDGYAQDDWRRAAVALTLNYGLRYEFFAPYTEKYGRLAFVDTNPDAMASQGSRKCRPEERVPFSGKLPDSLVFPFTKAFAPRVGIAWRLAEASMVVRAGFGMNYTVGQYAGFAQNHGARTAVCE